MKWLIIFFVSSFLFTVPVFADENFDVEYDMFYHFLENGNTQVTQTTTLINKKTNLYATEYEFVLGAKLIGTVSAFDATGNLPVTSVNQDPKKSIIKVSLNEKAVGTGNKMTFSISYQVSDLVHTVGRIREVAVPKPSEDASLIKYSIKISIPKSFGQIGFIKPKNSYQETESSYLVTFNYQQAKNGILIGLGDVAHFQFSLTYHLKNDSIIPKSFEIALPPDTRFQQVIYSSIIPEPTNVTIDNDGNWLAQYDLKLKQNLDIVASGNALIYATPREGFAENPPSQDYIKADKFWETQDQHIKEIARSNNSSEQIYSYINKAFSYNYARVNSLNQRLGALQALTKPSDVICMEFTDSFIALSRAAGIPSREVNGYAYTSDEYLKPLSLVADILHSWPEYWDSTQQVWVAVDPTWGNTTHGLDYFSSMDFNHFAFVRRGISSTYPYPAGSYRFDQDSKYVEITVQKDLPVIQQSVIEYSIDAPSTILSGSETNIKVNLKNPIGIARYAIPIEVKAEAFTNKISENLVNLPPFGKKTITITLKQTGKKFWGLLPIRILVSGEEKTIQLKMQPIELLYFPAIVVIFLLLLGLLYVSKRKA